jgi:hypothetical protein
VNADDDPGWRPALRPIWMFLLPWIALPWITFHVRRRRLDLIGLRRVFLHVGVALVEFAIVISSTLVEPARDATWAWVFLGIGTGVSVAGLLWSAKAPRRGQPDPSDLHSAESVSNGFRALSFIRLGLAASPALYGIVGTQLTETAEVSFGGVVVSLALFAVFGPTRSRVDEIQERLRLAGSRVSLRAALDETAT